MKSSIPFIPRRIWSKSAIQQGISFLWVIHFKPVVILLIAKEVISILVSCPKSLMLIYRKSETVSSLDLLQTFGLAGL